MSTRIRRLLFVALLAVPSAACGAAADRAEEDLERELEAALGTDGEIDVEVDSDTGVIRAEGPDASYVKGENQGRPEWLPAPVPLPDDLTIDISSVIGDIRSLRGSTALSAAELREMYREAAVAAGYHIAADAPPISNEEIVLLAHTDSGEPLDVRVGGDGTLVIFLGRAWE